jgi:hypothetical protein
MSGPVVGAREIDGQPRARDRHLAVDVDVLLPVRVVVDVGVRLVDAVGPARHLVAETALREGDDALHRRTDGLDAEALADLLQPPDTELRRADLCAQVAEEGRRPVVRRIMY